jgi:diaminopropionate ammonia-lyase
MYFNRAAASWAYTSTINPQVEPFHRSLPDYAVTPLIPLPDLAKELGLGHVLVKDECNLPSTSSLQEVGTAAKKEGIRLVSCTEGNWGRAVARMASYLHITAIIFVPDFMDRATQQKIQSEGAEVVVVDGDYDHSVQCARDEADKGGLLVMVRQVLCMEICGYN